VKRVVAAASSLLAGLLPALPGCAAAETLVTSVSTPRVAIQSNFAGVDVVVFGGILGQSGLSPHGRYDIVVTIRGPATDLDVRQKARSAGIWINSEKRRFPGAPSFLAVASTRPVDAIASADTILRFGLSLETAIDPRRAATADPYDHLFRSALIRLKQADGLYVEQQKGVTFLSDQLFRASIPLPANVPLGIYQVDTRLLVDGEVATGQRASLEVIKTGFEDQVAQWSEARAPLYGLATCAIALTLGWLATLVFRRD
jgi:uncharacterized protein (TIGR02186 family)